MNSRLFLTKINVSATSDISNIKPILKLLPPGEHSETSSHLNKTESYFSFTFSFHYESVGDCHLKYRVRLAILFWFYLPEDGTLVPKHVAGGT